MLLRLLVAGALLAGLTAAAGAQPARERQVVAMHPLTAEARLKLYGQPVAAEIARALGAGQIDVVVVAPTVPVPSRARLVVEGKIARAEGGAIVLEIRVRDPVRGAVVATLSARASSLTTIDKAAADLAARLLPEVRTQLAAIEAAEAARARPPVAAAPAPAVVPVPAPPLDDRAALVAGVGKPGLVDAAGVAGALAGRLGYGARRVPDAGARALQTLSASAPLAIHVEVLALEPANLGVPVARARARVRVYDHGSVAFDRVVHTDTLVGGRSDGDAAMAGYVGRQIVDIVAPRLGALRAGAR